MKNEEFYNLTSENILEVHYPSKIGIEEFSRLFSELLTYIKDNPVFQNGVEFLVDMTNVTDFLPEEIAIISHFVKDTNIIRTAAYGTSKETIKIREGIYMSAGKIDKTHYFATKEAAIAWILAERIANNYKALTNTNDNWSVLNNTNQDYIEIIYAKDVNFENQVRLLDDFDMITEPKIESGDKINVLIDLTKTKTFSDAAQLRTKQSIVKLKNFKVASFASEPHIKTVRDLVFKESNSTDNIQYFNSREEALEWLLG